MKTKLLILLCLLVLVGACSRRPEGVLSARKMTDVLVDLHKADGVLKQKSFDYGHEPIQQACYQSVLDKHQITQAQFDSSLVWYTDHPIRFNRIYPNVIARLEKERDLLIIKEEEMRALSRTQKQLQLRTFEEWIAEIYASPEVWKREPQTPYGMQPNGRVDSLFLYGIKGECQHAVFNAQDSVWKDEFYRYIKDTTRVFTPDSLEKKGEKKEKAAKTCEIEKKVVPLQPLSNKGNIVRPSEDAIILRKKD